MTSSNPAKTFAHPKQAIIVGGGPAGTLMALYLAQMNWTVSVYERRSSYLQSQNTQSSRTYNIILSPRGLVALKQAGVTLPQEDVVALKGNVRHSLKGAKKSSGFREAVSINRNLLAKAIFQAGISRLPQHLQYHFDHCLELIDFDQKIATFKTQETVISQQFDLLVGADGVFSTVREMMVKQFEAFNYQQNRDEMTFKIFPLDKATEFTDATQEWGECFHTWPSSQPATILAPPNPDGSLTGILILPQVGEFTFEKIKTQEDVNRLFSLKFPDIFQNKLIPQDFIQNLLEQKIAYGGITTICSALHSGDSIVLVGDAAHSMWPSLGQGCNVALESCRILAEILTKNQEDLQTTLPHYTSVRKPNTDAAGRLSEQGFGGNKRAGTILFFAKIISLSLLNKVLPKLFSKPALLQLNEIEFDYAEIEAQWQQQDRQLLVLLTGLIVFIISIIIIVRIEI